MPPSNISSVVNFFSTANEGFATTLSSTITAGATTVPLTSVTNLTNGSIFVGIIEPGLPNQQVFTGTVNTGGSEITSVVWTRAPLGGNVGHVGGVTIVDYVTGTDWNMMSTGILKQHTQAGKHTGITTDTISTTGTATLAQVSITGNNGVAANNLATNAITLGYATPVTTTQSSITASSATQVTGLTKTVTVPAGGRQLEIKAHIPNADISSGGAATIFVSIWDGIVGSGTQLQEDAVTLGANTYSASYNVEAYPTPSAGSKTYNVGVRVNNGATIALNFAATAPGTLIVKAI